MDKRERERECVCVCERERDLERDVLEVERGEHVGFGQPRRTRVMIPTQHRVIRVIIRMNINIHERGLSGLSGLSRVSIRVNIT